MAWYRDSFYLLYAIRKAQENKTGLRGRRTYGLLLVYADVVLLEVKTDTIKKNTGAITDASKEVNLEAVSSPDCRAVS
jgi:hypothetical protein